MENPKISIIVPVYKVEKYLNRCLDSIVAQTFSDWECILIDDGSPDNSGKICDEYAKKDDRFVVIHQKNSGVSVARNIGLNNACGEWIGFVDSDDWIEKDTYETALKYAREKKADVVEWGMFLSNDDNDFENLTHTEGTIELNKMHAVLLHGPCNKLIKRQIVVDNAITFPVGISLAEDMNFVIKVFFYSQKSYGIPKSLYHYYRNDNGAVNTITYKKIEDEVKSIKDISNFLKSNNANQSWYDLLEMKKSRVKNRYLFNLDYPDFNAWRNTFPEVSTKIVKDSSILKKIFYFCIYNRLDYFAIIIFKIRFMLRAS